MFQKTTATRKIFSLNKRIRGVSGGTSASKTISILLWCIDYAQSTSDQLISIVSETMPHLKRGAMRDFEKIMTTHGYWREDRWNASNFVYTFETGSKIEFFSVEQSDKVRGLRREVLFVNEANNIDLETFTQLEIRTRKIVWLDWNPVSEFWWYTDIMPFTDVDFITLTYKDNEGLSPLEVASLEAHKNNPNKAQWWKVYGEGQLGEAEGRIYTGWNICESVPFSARLESIGVDFGYTNDPTAIVGAWKFNDGFILDEIAYTRGLSNKNIADILLNTNRALVIADSAEPKSIDEIKSYGVNIVPTTKGQGSILQGIQFVQDQKISVTQQSTNLIKEYRNYLWLTNKDGKTINEPSPMFNHSMDAVRYALSKYFVKVEPEEKYHPVNVEAVRKARAVSDYGGVTW